MTGYCFTGAMHLIRRHGFRELQYEQYVRGIHQGTGSGWLLLNCEVMGIDLMINGIANIDRLFFRVKRMRTEHRAYIYLFFSGVNN